MYYTQEQIDRANQADLVSFLQGRGEQLTRAGQEYRWKRHDSLTVRGNKWYRHSQSKGGAPIDFVMEFYGKSFTEAVRYPVYRDWPVKTEKIRYFTVKNYVVFYSCNEKNLTVSIVRVIYGGRDIAAELKKTDSFHA